MLSLTTSPVRPETTAAAVSSQLVSIPRTYCSPRMEDDEEDEDAKLELARRAWRWVSWGGRRGPEEEAAAAVARRRRSRRTTAFDGAARRLTAHLMTPPAASVSFARRGSLPCLALPCEPTEEALEKSWVQSSNLNKRSHQIRKISLRSAKKRA